MLEHQVKNRSWAATVFAAALLAATGVATNEVLLRASWHRPSLVSDADLWCSQRARIESVDSSRTVLLLGASRMQTNINLNTLSEIRPELDFIQLAISGRGTSFPVFQDIVTNTDFSGLVLISETESTLASDSLSQSDFVQHFHRVWSLDRALNRSIANEVQGRFVFPNPNSSSLRLWGNLLVEREAPEPMHVMTDARRQQYSDFQIPGVVERVNSLRASSVSPEPANAVLEDGKLATAKVGEKSWVDKVTAKWGPSIDKFTDRGGRVVVVRMPVSEPRRISESKEFPLEKFWMPAMRTLGVESIHCFEHDELCDFDFPDSSHLDYRDASAFTNLLLNRLNALVVKSIRVTDASHRN